jgi:hypothetical protein
MMIHALFLSILALAGAVTICGGIPFLASLFARRLWPLLGEGHHILIATLLVPILSAVLTFWAIIETYREALQSSEDGDQLVIFTWVVAGGMLIAIALPLGFFAGKLAKRMIIK